MKLNSHYKFESTFSLNEIITSDKIHAIISDAASQISELQDKKRVEILEVNASGLCTFGVERCNKNEYPIHWDVKLNIDDIICHLKEIYPGFDNDHYLTFYLLNLWDWTLQYLNQVDFETLEYL